MLAAVKLEKELWGGGGRDILMEVMRDQGFDLIGNNKSRICCTFLHVCHPPTTGAEPCLSL